MNRDWTRQIKWTLAASLALAASGAHAATFTYQEGVSPSGAYTADSTTIRSDMITTPQDDDPDDENIIGHIDASRELRGLFEFDLDGIAPGSIINSAQLDMVTRAGQGGQGSSLTVDLYRYDYDFIENLSTWNDPAGDGSDPTAGGTITTPVLSSTNFNPSTTSLPVTFGSTGAFTNAVTAASSGGSLRLLATGQQTTSFVRFADETAADTSVRPKLTVDAVAPIYEPFAIGGGQYTADTDVRTQNPPNAGFTGPWAGGSAIYQPIADDMSYQIAPNHGLVTSGGSLQIDIPADSNGREVTRPVTDISTPGTFYVSMLMRINATSNVTTSDDLAFTSLRPAGNNTNAISWGVFNGDLALRMRSTPPEYDYTLYELESGYQNDHTYLFVLKIEKNVSGFDDRVTVWVDPTMLGSEYANTAAVSELGRPLYDATILDEFRVYTDNFEAGEFQIDELRIGGTWDSVLAYTIPTPAALPAGLALLAGCLLRRHRA